MVYSNRPLLFVETLPVHSKLVHLQHTVWMESNVHLGNTFHIGLVDPVFNVQFLLKSLIFTILHPL